MIIEPAIIIFFLLGFIFGSFANVCIYRIPRDLSVIKPRSACIGCKKPIAWYHNIPVFSWVFLRGKCANCGIAISARYPLVETLMGVLFALVFARHGWSWITLEYLIFVFGLVICTFIDLEFMIIPDIFSLSGIVIGLAGAAINPERSFWEAVIGILIGGGFLWLIAYLYFLLTKREGLGGGDIKLLGWIGAVLGWKAVPFVITSSAFVGSMVGIAIMLIRRKDMQTAIPFGPYLALGSVCYVLFAESLASSYFSLFLPGLQ
ncbi:MAG: prepilin peptidase [Bdellovibrionota bacterium]